MLLNFRWWQLAFLLLWGGLLFGGFLFGTGDGSGRGRMPTATRMASSLTLVVAAWSWYGEVRAGPAGPASLLVALGMTLGFVGDLCMAQLVPLSPHVLWGMGTFGLGHVAYMVGLAVFGNRAGLTAPVAFLGALGFWLLVGVIGWWLLAWPSTQPAPLRWAALPYILLLCGTAGWATGLAWQAPRFAPLALGAGLFLASDLILGAELFRQWHFPLSGDVIWLTYGPGQMLIVYGFNAAAAHGATG